MTLTRCHFDAMTAYQHRFKTVEIHICGEEVQAVIVGRFMVNESDLNQLADDIRSAQCWLRDVRRRQADNETPELPME